MQPNNMSWEEMVEFIKENPGAKVFHPLFSPREYLYSDGMNVYTEEGYLFDDFTTSGYRALRDRRGGSWETNWSCIENPNCF